MSFDNLMGYILSIPMCMQNFITIFHSVHFFRIWCSAKSRPMINVILQFLELDIVNINVYAKFYQNIPNGLRVKFQFSEFESRQNLDQSQMSLDNLMSYITSISMFMQNFITIFHSAQELGPFSLFSEFGARQDLDRWKNVISQSLGLDLVNINVYAKVYQNIPLSSRDWAIFTFFQNLALGKASTKDKCHFATSWTRCRQYQCVCKILSKYSKRFKS